MNIKPLLCACCVLWIATSAYADTTVDLISNSDFDSSSVPSGSYQYETEDSFWAAAWLFDETTSGIANSATDLGGEAATNTVAFLWSHFPIDSTPFHGSTSQFISSEARDFTISFKLAQAPSYTSSSVDVFFDNKRIAQDLTPSSTSFVTYNLTVQDSVTTGAVHFITFRSSSAVDGMVFLDDVVVTAEY